MVKKVLGMVLVLALAIGIAAAWAEEIRGTIQTVDASARMLVLEDGTQLWVAEGVPMDRVKEGAQVKASYEERDGKKIATDLEVSD